MKTVRNYRRVPCIRINLIGRKEYMEGIHRTSFVEEFIENYTDHFEPMLKNPFLYVILVVIVRGGNTPQGRIISALTFVILIPLFNMRSEYLREKLRLR